MIVQLGLAQDNIYSSNHSDTKWCLQPTHHLEIHPINFTRNSHNNLRYSNEHLFPKCHSFHVVIFVFDRLFI